MRIRPTESLRFPGQRSSSRGKSGPKPRQQAQAKDNRRKFLYRMGPIEDGVTQGAVRARGWKSASKAAGRTGGKSPVHKAESRPGAEPSGEAKPDGPHCREKLLTRGHAPVPQTDTGGRGENPEVRGKTLVKELGKMYP